MLKEIGNLGDWIANRKVTFYNRTGATLKYGHVAMCDIAGTQSETSDIKVGPTGPFANLTPVAQTLFEDGAPIVVCADPAGVADNASGMFWICGVVEVAVLDDDVSTTDIDRGNRVSMVVSESAVAVQEYVTGGTGTRAVGLALEDAAASSATAARTIDANCHLRDMIWWGGIPGMNVTDT